MISRNSVIAVCTPLTVVSRSSLMSLIITFMFEPAKLQMNQTKADMQSTFSNIAVDLGNSVPTGVELLYHLCYGDSGHRHVVEPTDMGDMVDFANLISERIARPI